VGQLRCVCDGGPDGLWCQGGEAGEYLLNALTIRQVVQSNRDHDPRAFDAGLAVAGRAGGADPHLRWGKCVCGSRRVSLSRLLRLRHAAPGRVRVSWFRGPWLEVRARCERRDTRYEARPVRPGRNRKGPAFGGGACGFLRRDGVVRRV
jgi:hypothetical protein